MLRIISVKKDSVLKKSVPSLGDLQARKFYQIGSKVQIDYNHYKGLVDFKAAPNDSNDVEVIRAR